MGKGKGFLKRNLGSDSCGTAGSWRCGCRRHRRRLKFCVIGHHSVKADTNAFDDCEKDSARYRAVAHRFVAAAHGEGASREETGDDSIPGVLLLPYSLDSAVVCVEKTSPDTKVAAEHGGARFDRCEGTNATLAVGGVAKLRGC